MPQLVNLGGGVLAHPKIQPIFFAGDDEMQAQIEDFAAQLATSSYWTAAASEYGVGAPTILPTIVEATAPDTEAKLDTLLTNRLGGTAPAWPYDPDTIYSVFLPEGLVLTGSDGSKSCQDYGAYHFEVIGPNNQSIIYALMPRCDYTVELDDLTSSASHEWLEAATDPRILSSDGGWGDSDPDNYVWFYVPGSEVGDYCEYLDVAYQRDVGDYLVQRSWSNAAAKAGHDPCVPAPDGEIYVGAAPVFTETVAISGLNGTVQAKGVTIPVGMSKTIEVKLYSDAPLTTDYFRVDAMDLVTFFGAGAPELTFSWDRSWGKNGDTLHLTITRMHAGTFIPGGSEFVISTSIGALQYNQWWAFAK